MPPITVKDALRLALPAETMVTAAEASLSHQITWIATPRATPPAFVNLRGGELILASVEVLHALDAKLTLATLIERLASVPIAAIAITGALTAEAKVIAENTRIPLLALPDNSDIREVEREMQRLFNDYDAQIERRGAQLAQTLTQRALAGAGLQGLIDLLAQRSGCGVGCYSPSGELRRMRARGSPRVALQTFQPANAGVFQHLAQEMLVLSIGAGSERMGFLVLCNERLDDWDRNAAQQGRVALALELTKEQAVQAAEERIRGDFVQAVLSGQATDSEAVRQRGRELGYNLQQSHTALLCTPMTEPVDDGLLSQITTLISSALNMLGMNVPTMRRADSILCYIPTGTHAQRSSEIAEHLRQRLTTELPVIVAIGREASSIADWKRSLGEAEQALLIGRELLDTTQVLDYTDLGIYRLLILLGDKPELWEFYRSTLIALVNYDHDQRAELLKTLTVFFDNLGNLARTAEALHVHRNTLLYRIERINSISGLDIDNPDDRLALWLALKAHRVIQSLERTD